LVNIQTLRRQIVEAGKRAYQRGYAASNDGNISARIDENRIIVTPAGVSKGFMKPADMVIVDMDGQVKSVSGKPSSEVFMHLQVYKDRPDINSVCHAHPPYATGFAAAGIPLDHCILPEVILTLGQIPLVKYGTPGTDELYKPMIKLLPDHDAFLLANHGALTIGTDVINAYHKMETVEHFAHIAFVAHQLGNIAALNSEQVKKLTDMRPKYGIRTTAGCVTQTPQEQDKQSENTLTADERASLIKEITDRIIAELKQKY